MNILLVDDEATFLEQSSIFLSRGEVFAEAILDSEESLNTVTANSVEEALDKLDSEEDYEVIISDFKMPDKNGIEFLRIVREERDSEIPFILFTGKGNEDIALEALEKGANMYLEKSGDPDSQYRSLLQASVQEALHKREIDDLKTQLEECRSKNK